MAVAQIGTVHPARDAFGANPVYNGMEWRSEYAPKYHVYLFNISAREFTKVGKINLTIPGVRPDDPTEVAEPVTDPKTKRIIRYETIKGGENQRYRICTSFPQPMLISRENEQDNTIGSLEMDAVRYVIDLIYPDNLTRTLDFEVAPENTFSVGTNLAQKGVFFSFTNPPLREDVEKAYKRMEKYYNGLLQTARQLEHTDKGKLSELLSSNPDFAYAADYFGRTFDWHKPSVRPVECPNCGEAKKQGAKFHLTSFGVVCVEQTSEAWRSAVNSGVKTLDSVPPDFRWDKPSKPAQPPTV